MKNLIFTILFSIPFVFLGAAQNCQANFNYLFGYNNAALVHFNNQSSSPTLPGGKIAFSWDFGDGTSSTSANPSKTYAQGGNYSVCLSLIETDTISGLTCLSTFCDSVFVNITTSCQANFTSQITGGNVQFNNMSSFLSVSSAIVDYSWNFGDNTISSSPNPSHQYATPGVYNVCLYLTENDTLAGSTCTSTFCDSIVIAGNCAASFTNNSNQASGTHIGFSNTSIQSNIPNTAVSYSWDFGDGNFSSAAQPISHLYAQPGTYAVCLTMVESGSSGSTCSSSFCDSIYIAPIFGACQANYSFLQSSTNSKVYTFNNTSSGIAPSGTFNQFVWDFGDGTSSNLSNPTHAYSQLGMYVACLTISVTDSLTGSFCSSTYCDTIMVIPGTCTANFTNNGNQTFSLNIGFNNTSVQTNTIGASISYSWDFGDGTVSNMAQPISHLYAQPGVYNVCLTITESDSSGAYCTSTFCDSVVVGGIRGCSTSFVATIDPYQNHAYFQTYTPHFPKHQYVYYWDFGDGATGLSNQNTSHIYSQPGTYNVCLVVNLIDSITGTIACADTFCNTIVVNPILCKAGYSIIDSVYNPSTGIPVFNTSTFATGSIVQYLWNFGDGSTSNQPYPSHTYANFGAYNLCLTLTSINTSNDTCISTYCHQVSVDSAGNIYFKRNNSGFTINVMNPNVGVELSNFEKLQVFPNPASNSLFIDLGESISKQGHWTIMDLRGTKLAESNFDQVEFFIDISHFPNGIYILNIQKGQQIESLKIHVLR